MSLAILKAHSEDSWSDWADAQADLSLGWVHRSFCWFCHALAHLSFSGPSQLGLTLPYRQHADSVFSPQPAVALTLSCLRSTHHRQISPNQSLHTGEPLRIDLRRELPQIVDFLSGIRWRRRRDLTEVLHWELSKCCCHLHPEIKDHDYADW